MIKGANIENASYGKRLPLFLLSVLPKASMGMPGVEVWDCVNCC